MLELADYDIEIHHLKGTANGRADALSRRPDYDRGERDNEKVVVLPESVFVRSAETTITNQGQDEDILRAWVDPHNLKKIDGLWTKAGQRVVTGGQEEKRYLIGNLHDPPVYGHPGISRTVDFIEQHYWWPGLRKDVQQYVQGCTECQRHKVNN